MSSLPFIKFYPSDWLSEESLRLVSFAARGLWIDMLCLMAKSERRGYLTLNGGVNPTLAQVGKLVGSNEAEITPLLDELKRAGTCSVEDQTSILFSRRMVRDTHLYEQAVSYGSKGGNPKLKKGLTRRVKGTLNPNRQPSLGSNMGSGTLGSGTSGFEEGNAKGNHLPKKCPLQLRVDRLWGKRMTTPWSSTELTAWKTAKAVVAETTEEEWAVLEKWFALPETKASYRRTDPAALLNNWHAEIPKAVRNMANNEGDKPRVYENLRPQPQLPLGTP